MIKTKVVQIKAHEATHSVCVCDTCGKEMSDISWGKMKLCHICKDHVCQDCAIITDHWYLEDGQFSDDYPDYYCPHCWEVGAEIRTQIQEARDLENKLWEQWHDKLAKEDRIHKLSDSDLRA